MLADKVGAYLSFVADWTYYTGYSSVNLYKVQTNGHNNTELNTIVSASSVVGNEIYHAVNENNGYSIYKMNTD